MQNSVPQEIVAGLVIKQDYATCKKIILIKIFFCHIPKSSEGILEYFMWMGAFKIPVCRIGWALSRAHTPRSVTVLQPKCWTEKYSTFTQGSTHLLLFHEIIMVTLTEISTSSKCPEKRDRAVQILTVFKLIAFVLKLIQMVPAVINIIFLSTEKNIRINQRAFRVNRNLS